jgi:hexosaminidase
MGAYLNFAPPNDSAAYYPYDDYTGITDNNWRKMYAYNPTNGLTDEESKLVIGGEVIMYTEQVDAATLDGVVWPRASAVAEVLWSGAKDWSGQNRSQITASPRLAEFRERMLLRGIKGNMVQMVYCLQGSGYSCSLQSVGNAAPGPDGTFSVTDSSAGLVQGQDAAGGAVAAGAAAAGAVAGAAG